MQQSIIPKRMKTITHKHVRCGCWQLAKIIIHFLLIEQFELCESNIGKSEDSVRGFNGNEEKILFDKTFLNDILPIWEINSKDIVAQFSLVSKINDTKSGSPPNNSSSKVFTTTFSSNSSNASPITSNNYKHNYFTHFVYDKDGDRFYAGATNKILQFDSNLQLLSEAITGPLPDSPQCHAGGCPDEVETNDMNNYNKVLVVSHHYGENNLIACGSLRQGACEIYRLRNFPSAKQFVGVPLAANDEFSSTYAFIGPAQYSWKKEDILYVGTTFTNVGDYRHDVPAISSRRLEDLNYAEFSIQQSIINIDVKYRDHFLVDYIYGFNSSDYAYFAIVQKKSHLAEEAGYLTRLARICITDPNYDTYTEITIQCRSADSNMIDYNILRDAKVTTAGQRLAQKLGIKRGDSVLVGVFSPSKEISNKPESNSAVCVYSLKEIEDIFSENLHMCFNGTIKDRNLGYISGTINDGRCPKAGALGNIYNFCSVGLKISGVSPIQATALFSFSNVSVSSITSTIAGKDSLAFLGTELGTIKKVLLSGPNPGQYEEIAVDPGSAILRDTMISADNEFLYVLSEKKITKLRIEHCSIYMNCTACLESRDPFCGWCSLEKRCTIRSACQKDTSAARWLSLGSGQQCIDFESILPDKIPINQEIPVQLVIRTLPEPNNGKYRCVFGNSTPIDADMFENGLSCSTPPLSERPLIPLNADHVVVPLAVRSSETNKDFVSRTFAYFDCSRHVNCQGCLNSRWNCSWCIFDNRCVYKKENCRSSETTVILDRQECPHLKTNHTPILIPVRVPMEIRLEIENLPKPKSSHSGFLCNIKIEAAQMLLPARVEFGRVIVCERTLYFYEANTHEYKASVDVTWNRQHYVDTAVVTLYKCDILGSHRDYPDCSLCITRDPKYKCAWCANSCVFNETCGSNDITAASSIGSFFASMSNDNGYPLSVLTNLPQKIQHHSDSYGDMAKINECPKPRIDIIKPLSGPIEGGTLITIEGSNLGIKEEDVRDKIFIGNTPCELVSYEISVKIECKTGPVLKEMSASVRVANDAGFTESSVQFHYKNILLSNIMPTQGPKSGGTQISIIGKFLNIGSNVRAYMDDYECFINITQASSSRITCITSEAVSPGPIEQLKLYIDGASRTLKCSLPFSSHNQDLRHDLSFFNSPAPSSFHKRDGNYINLAYMNRFESPSVLSGNTKCSIFNYTPDPVIMEIKPLRSFVSGGRLLNIHGNNLDSIQKPEIEVSFGEERINKSHCNVINANQLECPTPPVNYRFLYNKNQFIMKNTSVSPRSRKIKNRVTNSSASILPSSNSLNSVFLVNADGHGSESNLDIVSHEEDDFSYIYSTISNSEETASLFNSKSEEFHEFSKIHETQLNLQIGFIMDNVPRVNDLNKYFPHVRSTIVYFEDPKYIPFQNGMKIYKGDTLVIEGDQLNLAADEYDVNVTIGMQICNITSLALTQLVCLPPATQPEPTDEIGQQQKLEYPLVVVRVGKNLRYEIGYLKYELIKSYSYSHAIFGVTVTIIIFFLLLSVTYIIYKRKSTQAEREYKRIQIQMITLESNVRSECKQAFAELQTDMTDLTADLENTGIPTLDHINYIMKVFFPGVQDHPILNSAKYRSTIIHTNYDAAMLQFEQLISNKYFILTFIETLESQKSFNIRDKVNVASLLMIVLMNKMEYATDILKCLLLKLIEKSVNEKHADMMLRKTESVVEKMLTNYLAICMYDYLKEYAGSSLFLLFKAIKHQIEKGLVDAITNDARYSLCEDHLLHEPIQHSVIQLHIMQDDLDEKIVCKVLNWDTITQVKSKILDALFKNTPFSMRPSVYEVDLEWRHGRGGHLILQDMDLTTKTVNGWRRLNTLEHYGVKDSAVMSLIAKQSDEFNLNHNKVEARSESSSLRNYFQLNSHSLQQEHVVLNEMHESNQLHLENRRVYHLVKPLIQEHNTTTKQTIARGFSNSEVPLYWFHQHQSHQSHPRSYKTIPEVYLTRLLAAKGTIQKFVDDFFGVILTVNEELPPSIKWLYDLFDESAKRYDIKDVDILHAWKSNALPLRFWVNFIKNPDFIFDVNKSVTMDSCLSVIAQTFMDSCSTTEHRLGKDSPSNKLLFAKDIPHYRKMLKQFYRDVAKLPTINDQEMNTAMQHLSVHQNEGFDTIAALKELYIYVTKYKIQILDALDSNSNCRKMNLTVKLQHVERTLVGDDRPAC